MIKSNNLRANAAQICQAVIRKQISLSSLMSEMDKISDISLLQEITYGTVRYFNKIEAIARRYLNKPISRTNDIITFVLAIGIYQLLHTRIPPYAAINETVESLKILKQSNFCGLVNAVLHKVLLGKASADNFLKKETEIYSHPHWLIQAIKKDYPKKYKEILTENNRQAPFWIRVNTCKIQLNEYIRLLKEAGISIKTTNNISGICIDKYCDVNTLPFFKDGWCYIQDLAAQQASIMLDPHENERILDACAAPGGKTTHIVELCNGKVDLVALDIKTSRLEKLRENLERNHCNITVIHGSADDPGSWWDGNQFDRILIDAPCSGTGVIRRHPDIKFLRSENNIIELVKTQKQILESLWPLLKNGGTLLYSTCSILKRENSTQINDFLYRHRGDAVLSDMIQALPGENEQDGFFYAKIKKRLN